MSRAELARSLADMDRAIAAFSPSRVAREVTAEIMSEILSEGGVTGHFPVSKLRSTMEPSRIESERREVRVGEARAQVLSLYRQGRVDGRLLAALAEWNRAERDLTECHRARREAELFEGGAL